MKRLRRQTPISADGGETNLVALFRFHHRAVHEGGLNVARCDDGAWLFTNKHRQSLFICAPGHTHPIADWTFVPTDNARRGIVINPRTAATRWQGERMDYGVAIDSLLCFMVARPEGFEPPTLRFEA